MTDILLLAASGLAREVASADLPGLRIVGILDDDPALYGTKIAGASVLGKIDSAASRGEHLLICVGSGSGRRSIATRLKELGVSSQRYATAVDASVRVPLNCSIGPGSIILAGVVLTADIDVGSHVVVMPNTTFTHDDRVADFATIAAGVSLGGGVRVGEAAYLGMGSNVRERLSIGAESVLGMGSVLVRDLPPGFVWAGNPAAELSMRRIV
ncbi:MAG: NeuD/PglB/VioB family sugar acetyltransferase [Salinibacterium sp.]|nr:NeuD/PglB/VioB family sugar acetyltransferase [Salinibacterium sp.]